MAKPRRIGIPRKPYLPLVRAGSAFPFIGFLQTAGVPVERHLAATRLASIAIDAPESLVPLRPVLEFFDHAATAEGIQNFGLLVGARTEIDDLGALGRLILRSVTVGDALRTAAANIPLYNSGERIWLRQEKERILICHSLDACGSGGERHGHLFAIMLLIKIIRLAAGPGWCPREIRLSRSEAHGLKTYGAVLPADWMYHAEPFSAVVVDRSLFAQRFGHRMPGGKSHASDSPPRATFGQVDQSPGGVDDAAFLRESAPARDLGHSVQQAIGGLLHGGYPGIRLAADLAGLSVRTLTRRLAKEGTSYERLVEEVRCAAALDMLRGGRLRLIDIAYELGYADPANFTRAFRRWTGMPPSEYRRLCDTGSIDSAVVS